MRKFTKILLAGTGIVFAGAVGYALLKKPDVENSNVPPKETSDIVRTSTREFVERRKKRIAEMRAAQKAEQEKIPTVHTVTENADREETDPQTTATSSEQAISGQPEEKPCEVVENPEKSE